MLHLMLVKGFRACFIVASFCCDRYQSVMMSTTNNESDFTVVFRGIVCSDPYQTLESLVTLTYNTRASLVYGWKRDLC